MNRRPAYTIAVTHAQLVAIRDGLETLEPDAEYLDRIRRGALRTVSAALRGVDGSGRRRTR